MNTEQTAVLKAARIAIIILTVFLAVEIITALKNVGSVPTQYNSISVSGEGEAFAIPDTATFSFSISADGKSVPEAQRVVTSKVNTILPKLKALGINDSDIKTLDYSVYPKYVYSQSPCTLSYPSICPPGRQTQDGFTVTETISVKVRKTDNAGQAISIAGENGATNISGVSFTIDDENKVVDEARAEAITDAKAKAKTLAKNLGVHLVRIASYSEGNAGGPVPMYATAVGGSMDKANVPPTLPLGQNSVKIVVNITYEIR